MIWTAISLLFAVFLLLDALRMRARSEALPALAPSDTPVDPDHLFFVRPGLDLDEGTRRAASAFARAEGLDVLDLVPCEIAALPALSFLQITDVAALGKDLFGPARTAGQALLVHKDVLARAGAGATAETPTNPAGFIRFIAVLKRYATRRVGMAAAPGLRAVSDPTSEAYSTIRELFGGFTSLPLAAFPAMLLLILFATVFGGGVGLVTLVAFHLQPLIALGGGKRLRSRDVGRATLLRTPLEIARWLAAFRGSFGPDPEELMAIAARPSYQATLVGGTGRFLEARRTTCPQCGGMDLAAHLSMPDMIQHKPGHFTLERCGACGHVFQNPSLSIEGLDFYYRDFYDGLGKGQVEFLFGVKDTQYVARARMLAGGLPEAATLLDVGCGHGHFCCVARDILPKVTFHGLDMSESVDDAVRRRWIDRGFRGLFVDIAPTMQGGYDVVSMYHYLEHVLDQRAELRAAHQALRPGGRLLIEVPDPEWSLGRWLGRYWVCWLQPQHLHFVSTKNLDRLLREAGFVPEAWERGKAHIALDFTVGLAILLNRLAPKGPLPWRPHPSKLRSVWTTLVWTVGLPFMLLTTLADGVVTRIALHLDRGNTYRVLARKDSPPVAPAINPAPA